MLTTILVILVSLLGLILIITSILLYSVHRLQNETEIIKISSIMVSNLGLCKPTLTLEDGVYVIILGKNFRNPKWSNAYTVMYTNNPSKLSILRYRFYLLIVVNTIYLVLNIRNLRLNLFTYFRLLKKRRWKVLNIEISGDSKEELLRSILYILLWPLIALGFLFKGFLGIFLKTFLNIGLIYQTKKRYNGKS